MSECRYWLERELVCGEGTIAFVMLNPSTADERRNDATIRRCLGFARQQGRRQLVVANLFALRSTSPRGLRGQPEQPTLAEVDAWRLALDGAEQVVAAWGEPNVDRATRRVVRARGVHFRRLARHARVPLQCLGTTAQGAPRHALFVAANVQPEPWPRVDRP